MSGTDASFLYAETRWQHGHTLKVLILEVSPGWTFAKAREGLGRRLPAHQAWTARLVTSPLRLHHPVWVNDRPPELDWHLRRHTLPPPGDDAALDAFVARYAAAPLDRRRPLWQVCVVEGVGRGRIAVVAKIHHGLADGAAVAALLEAVTSPGPDAEPLPAALAPPEPTPDRLTLLGAAVRDRVRNLGLLPLVLADSAVRLGRWAWARGVVDARPPLPFQAPFTSFNQPLTERRTFARASVPLAPVRRLKDAWGCTVNDVVMALVTSALRTYLLERGEPVDRPLVAAMPLSTASEASDHGNHLSNAFVSLPIHLADPVARLLALKASTASVKQVHERLGRDMMGRWLDFASSVGLRAFWGTVMRRFLPPPINLVVSNVRGPERRRWLGGSPMAEIWSVGPILERIGLNVTVWSYADRLYLGLLSCPRNVPWPAEIADAFCAALEELSVVGLPRPVTASNEPVDGAPFRPPVTGWLDEVTAQ